MFSLPTEKYINNEQNRLFLTRWIKRIFVDDWMMKLLSLIITLALWLGVSGLREEITTRIDNVKLKPRISNDVEITNPPPATVTLVVSGDRRKIDPIKTENLVVSLDLSDVSSGEQTIELTPQNVNVELPTGVRLEEIQPNKIAVKLENAIEREIPVRAETDNDLADKMEIYRTDILPQKVRVRGAESVLRSLAYISTERIRLEGKSEDFTAQQVPLNIITPNVTALDTAVNVVFKIGELRKERTFIVNAKAGNDTKKVRVILYGPYSIMENIKPENLNIEIVKNEKGEEIVRLDLPQNVESRQRQIISNADSSAKN
ncbi:MAG: CdaR family protein [Pyrinomonadaceae bacterium]